MHQDNGRATTKVVDLAVVQGTLKLSPRDSDLIAIYRRGDSLLTIAQRFGVTCAEVQRIVARVGDLGRVLDNSSYEREARIIESRLA
jgi:hypothetical protein